MSEVLVVHAVDTEGPLGGNARRLPDGSPEFLDTWEAIEASLAELTAPASRAAHADSHGAPYRFNWFILDFTGFATNPKHRVAAYHDTYDHLRALPTEPDGLYWHYHAPPADGTGDHWAESWLESNEHNVVLARRLLERGDFPAAFRAGGTIEDEPASRWLEDVFALDFSNRVSARSTGEGGLYAFDWYGAPAVWGAYHPSHTSVMSEGAMRRYVYRSLDLRSRYNDVGEAELRPAFEQAGRGGPPPVVSVFSHDNRDMRPETYDFHAALSRVAAATGVPWRSCTAVDAHRIAQGLDAPPLALSLDVEPGALVVGSDGPIFQPAPFVAVELDDGRFARLLARPDGERRWVVAVETARLRRAGAAATTGAAAKAVVAAELA
jgi:hypothetical protein